MSMELDSSEISSLFENLLNQEGVSSLFLSTMAGLTQESDPDQESPDQTGESVVAMDSSTRTLLIARSQSGLEAFMNDDEVPEKHGRRPASKSAVREMPRVEIGEKEEGRCVICLDEWSEGDVAAEMPCKHRFHSDCVEEWLGIHGTCPVCRREMPVEEEGEVEKKVEILFRIAINGGGRRNQASSEDEEADSEPMSESED